MPKRCLVICFSPTGSTRKLAEKAANATALPVEVRDITLPEFRSDNIALQPDDLVLLAAPVYFGRVQQLAAEFFAALRGSGQPAALIVNYGNRHYDDALLELYELAGQAGFVPVAAGAFISEHSFSTEDFPMAAGRPDSGDLDQAEAFGKGLLRNLEPTVKRLGQVPGNKPFKAYPDLHRGPLTTADCIACGVCVSLCPTGAVYIEDDRAATKEKDCIVCQACVKGCPENARVDAGPGATETRERLAPLTATRREPELFL